MNKRKKKYARCSCCDTEMHRTEMKIATSQMENLDKAQFKHYNELKFDPYHSFIDSDFSWACDSCISSKKAIMANPGLQNYCWSPHYAYFDSKHVCKSCQVEFTFSKEEKRFWYESLKFWIDSFPNKCVNCRKENRLLKIQNKALSEILKKEEADIEIAELKQVIDIYSNWQKLDKAKYYESVLRKREKTKSDINIK